MGIPARAALCAQLHCLSHNALWVLTAQHWSDPAAPVERPRSWLRLVRNGRVVQDLKFTGVNGRHELDLFWRRCAASYEPTSLSEDQMWVRLRELSGIQQAGCQRADCSGGGLPVAWWFCPRCGADARRVASGSMVAAHRRGDIRLPPARSPQTR